MGAGHWVLLVAGVLLSILGLGLTIFGAVLLEEDATQRDGQSLSGPSERFQSPGYALTNPALEIDPGQAGLSGTPDLANLASVPVGAALVVPGQEVSVGLAQSAEAAVPDSVEAQGGVTTEILRPAGTGSLIGGLIGLGLGIPLLLWGTAGLGRDIDPGRPGLGESDALAHNFGRAPSWIYPVRLTGHLDGQLSRGLWLVKWLLAIPHYIVLAVLWFALVITTIAAGLTVLFTGRYPRSWFVFVVGVLRWSWRVGFYAYSALGTDRYPPFTLAPAKYPAELDVAYPARLSRGLVLVKWWLLALPHLLILGILIGSSGVIETGWITGNNWGPSLLGILVLVAAVALLVTDRYPDGIFNLVVGLNRWGYRVLAYVLLLRDEYPPFRLDQGPTDPPAQAPDLAPTEPPVHGMEHRDTPQ
jgi:hypothetical protein